jgi:hypothetical protein
VTDAQQVIQNHEQSKQSALVGGIVQQSCCTLRSFRVGNSHQATEQQRNAMRSYDTTYVLYTLLLFTKEASETQSGLLAIATTTVHVRM